MFETPELNGSIEGGDEEISRAYEFFTDLKGEPPFPKVDRVK